MNFNFENCVKMFSYFTRIKLEKPNISSEKKNIIIFMRFIAMHFSNRGKFRSIMEFS